MSLTGLQIKQMIDGFIHECLDYEEDQRIDYGPVYPDIPEEHLVIVDDFTEDAQKQLKSGDYSKVSKVVDHILEVNNCQIPKSSLDYKKLCRETLNAQIKVLAIEKRRNEGDYSDNDLLPPKPETMSTTPAVTPVSSTPPEPSEPQSPLLRDLVEEWKNEHIRANLWKPRTISAYEGHFRVMQQIFDDDIRISAMNHTTVKAIKDNLLMLPTGMNKKKVFQDKTVPEILKLNETLKLPTMDVSTVNRYMITLGAFFKWCLGNGYMDLNYAIGKKVKTKKVRPDKQRDAFSPDDLTSMFKAPGYLEDSFRHPYQFWLPVLGLYTGARLNELCQLRLDDIQDIDGISTLILKESLDDPASSIKTGAGDRKVPVHPFIADDLNLKGYVEYLKAHGETRLFPELPFQNNNYGHKASKWFGRFRKSCGIDSSKKVYHSFRHTLTNNLKQRLINPDLIDELTGHVLQGESMGRYGKAFGVDVLYKEAVLRLNFEIALSHLKASKWVVR